MLHDIHILQPWATCARLEGWVGYGRDIRLRPYLLLCRAQNQPQPGFNLEMFFWGGKMVGGKYALGIGVWGNPLQESVSVPLSKHIYSVDWTLPTHLLGTPIYVYIYMCDCQYNAGKLAEVSSTGLRGFGLKPASRRNHQGWHREFWLKSAS